MYTENASPIKNRRRSRRDVVPSLKVQVHDTVIDRSNSTVKDIKLFQKEIERIEHYEAGGCTANLDVNWVREMATYLKFSQSDEEKKSGFNHEKERAALRDLLKNYGSNRSNLSSTAQYIKNLEKEVRKLRLREKRFFHDPLLRRRSLAEISNVKFAQLLIVGLQNELTALRSLYHNECNLGMFLDTVTGELRARTTSGNPLLEAVFANDEQIRRFSGQNIDNILFRTGFVDGINKGYTKQSRELEGKNDQSLDDISTIENLKRQLRSLDQREKARLDQIAQLERTIEQLLELSPNSLETREERAEDTLERSAENVIDQSVILNGELKELRSTIYKLERNLLAQEEISRNLVEQKRNVTLKNLQLGTLLLGSLRLLCPDLYEVLLRSWPPQDHNSQVRSQFRVAMKQFPSWVSFMRGRKNLKRLLKTSDIFKASKLRGEDKNMLDVATTQLELNAKRHATSERETVSSYESIIRLLVSLAKYDNGLLNEKEKEELESSWRHPTTEQYFTTTIIPLLMKEYESIENGNTRERVVSFLTSRKVMPQLVSRNELQDIVDRVEDFTVVSIESLTDGDKKTFSDPFAFIAIVCQCSVEIFKRYKVIQNATLSPITDSGEEGKENETYYNDEEIRNYIGTMLKYLGLVSERRSYHQQPPRLTIVTAQSDPSDSRRRRSSATTNIDKGRPMSARYPSRTGKSKIRDNSTGPRYNPRAPLSARYNRDKRFKHPKRSRKDSEFNRELTAKVKMKEEYTLLTESLATKLKVHTKPRPRLTQITVEEIRSPKDSLVIFKKTPLYRLLLDNKHILLVIFKSYAKASSLPSNKSVYPRLLPKKAIFELLLGLSRSLTFSQFCALLIGIASDQRARMKLKALLNQTSSEVLLRFYDDVLKEYQREKGGGLSPHNNHSTAVNDKRSGTLPERLPLNDFAAALEKNQQMCDLLSVKFAREYFAKHSPKTSMITKEELLKARGVYVQEQLNERIAIIKEITAATENTMVTTFGGTNSSNQNSRNGLLQVPDKIPDQIQPQAQVQSQAKENDAELSTTFAKTKKAAPLGTAFPFLKNVDVWQAFIDFENLLLYLKSYAYQPPSQPAERERPIIFSPSSLRQAIIKQQALVATGRKKERHGDSTAEDND
eukprot:g371.t1